MARKRKSKNLTLPILGLSLLVSLALALYYALPRPTSLQIAEVAGSPSNCAQVAFSDSFTGTTLDSTKWFPFSESGGTATVNGNVTLNIPANTTKDWGGMSLDSADKVEMEGDFVHEVTLNSLAATPTTSKAASFVFGLASPGWENWYRIEVYLNGDIQSYNTTNSVTTPGTLANAVYTGQPVKLKVVRIGTTIKTFYDVGKGYIAHSTFTNIHTGKLFIQLMTLSHAPEKPQATAVIDDYSLRCIPKLNISQNCNANPPVTNITWTDPAGTFKQIELESRDNKKLWYSKKVDASATSTDLTGFVGSNHPSNPAKDQPFVADPSKTYYVWAWVDGVNIPLSAGFKVCTPKPPVPTNYRHTCAPNGKSVKVSWDSVSGVNSYKIRLDDKAGQVTNYDNISNTEFMLDIQPGKTYSWWLHSHKDGYDSNQTSSLDFSCANTVVANPATPTPTPRPTLRPTVRPTSTPTPTLTPTPTPSPTFSPLPSNIPVVEAPPATPDLPASDASNTPKIGFFSRLLAWLTSLFE